jgi:hypothetical protein
MTRLVMPEKLPCQSAVCRSKKQWRSLLNRSIRWLGRQLNSVIFRVPCIFFLCADMTGARHLAYLLHRGVSLTLSVRWYSTSLSATMTVPRDLKENGMIYNLTNNHNNSPPAMNRLTATSMVEIAELIYKERGPGFHLAGSYQNRLS